MNTPPPAPSLFLELHVLVSHAPSNLNRDDVGAPKSVVFGGVRRLRISSQCLKRTWRLSDGFRSAVDKASLAKRTAHVRKLLEANEAIQKLSESARDGFEALLDSLGTTPKDASVEDDEEMGEETDKTHHLLFLSDEEAAAFADFAKDKANDLEKVIQEKRETATPRKGKNKTPAEPLTEPKMMRKTDAKVLTKLQKELDEHLKIVPRPVDVALFGRFLTSPGLPNVDAALQVAHALGVEPAVIEPDYFTAVDDLADSTGAGHLGEREIAASVFYKYAACDLRLLVQNLCPGVRRRLDAPESKREEVLSTKDAQEEKKNAVDVAAKSLRGLLVAAARAVPTGMKNSTAAQNPADLVHIVLRRDAPMSLANAFLKPVRPDDGHDPMALAVGRLFELETALQKAYGDEKNEGSKPVPFTLRVESKNALSLTTLGEQVDAAVRAALDQDPLLQRWGLE